jgi:hypothetical protein
MCLVHRPLAATVPIDDKLPEKHAVHDYANHPTEQQTECGKKEHYIEVLPLTVNGRRWAGDQFRGCERAPIADGSLEHGLAFGTLNGLTEPVERHPE